MREGAPNMRKELDLSRTSPQYHPQPQFTAPQGKRRKEAASSNATVSTSQTSAAMVLPKKKASGIVAGNKSKKKDTNKPKRCRSAYNYFFVEQRKIITAANPNATVSEIAKSVAEKWKRLSNVDKAPCEMLAATDKERYDCEMAVYKEDPNKPKKSRSAYNYFYSKQFQIIKAANPNASNVGEIGKSVAESWKRLSAKDKAPYENLAAADKERHDSEMVVYKAAEDKDGSIASTRDGSVKKYLFTYYLPFSHTLK